MKEMFLSLTPWRGTREEARSVHFASHEKELTAVEPCKALVHMWRLKSEVIVPSKKLNQDADVFICVKCHSPTKFIFDAKRKSFICILLTKL